MAIAKVINAEDGRYIMLPNDWLYGCDEVVIVKRDDSYLITPRNIAEKNFKESIGSFDESFFKAMEELEDEKRSQTQALQKFYETKKLEEEMLEQERKKAI